MRIYCSLFILLFSASMLSSQVVNTEKLRLEDSHKALGGEAALTFGMARNKAGQTLSLGSRLRLELSKGNSRWMFLGAYNRTQFNKVDVPGSAPKNFTNNGFAHLRYNYRINDFITWEAFSQGQFDEIQQLDRRLLAGTGPRIRLLRTDSSHLYVGCLYMYENEVSYNEFEDFPREENLLYDHRISTYFSGAYSLNNYFTINLVVYYQPKLTQWEDYRISSETSLSVQLSKTLSFNTYFQLIYDAKPPVPVPNTMYVLRNGLSVSF
ncbi:MAG: DUF481 domain-containing protein [Chitinophagales bacterium]|nr:DUF481 domain-containing protein [Chitinophagales bacterium]